MSLRRDERPREEEEEEKKERKKARLCAISTSWHLRWDAGIVDTQPVVWRVSINSSRIFLSVEGASASFEVVHQDKSR